MFDAWIAMAGALAFTDTETSRQEFREKYGRWPKDKERGLDKYSQSIASSYHMPVGSMLLAAKPKAPNICPCCHSREFKYHHSKLICSYCRTGV